MAVESALAGTAAEISLTRGDGSPDGEWDAFVDRTPGGHHVQTTMWARVKATLGWRSARVSAQRDGELVGGCQLLLRNAGPLGTVAFAPRAPLLADHDPMLLAAVLDGIDRLARRERMIYLKLQPPVDRFDVPDLLLARGFVESGLEAGPTATVRVDLRREPEELLGAMRASSRRNVRKAGRSGVAVREGGESDLCAFGALVEATGARQRFDSYPVSYYEEMWRAFGDRAQLLVAEHEGRALSALLLIGCGDTVIYKMGGWSGERSSIRPNELLHWHAIAWAREAGYRWYDLEGIDVASARARLNGDETAGRSDGLTNFKLGLGGDVVVFPATYDLSYRSLLAALLRRVSPRLDHWLPLANRALGRGR